MYINIHIYIERERDRCVYIYIYIYTHTHTHIFCMLPAPSRGVRLWLEPPLTSRLVQVHAESAKKESGTSGFDQADSYSEGQSSLDRGKSPSFLDPGFLVAWIRTMWTLTMWIGLCMSLVEVGQSCVSIYLYIYLSIYLSISPYI